MNRAIRKAVFPVGGLGTRFLPATKSVPKEMLPVVDKPLIQYVVEEAQAAGIEEFIFVTGRGKSAIEDHFDHSYELEDTLAKRDKCEALAAITAWVPPAGQVAFTRQGEPLGLGHAVLCARNLVGDEPFAVLLPDDLILSTTPCLKQMVACYGKVGGNLLAVMDVPPDQTCRYGIVDPDADDGCTLAIKGLVEKPCPSAAPSTAAVVGRYLLQPEIFSHLGRMERGAGGEIQLTDAMAHMIGGARFTGIRFTGQRFDCGDKIGFLHANLAFALAREDLAGELREIVLATARQLQAPIPPRVTR